MATFNFAVTPADPSLAQGPSLAERAAKQQQHFWRVRTIKTLERLENEARKMLVLEEELGSFAVRYYDAVGEAVERLTALEQAIAQVRTSNPVANDMVAIVAQRDASAARRSELKTRYRALAKEIHPDRAMVVHGQGDKANHMHTLNAAYQKGDLAGLLKLEAEMLISELTDTDFTNTSQLELALREVDRAAETYADGYRRLLNSPINELMLRAMQARLAGWDWMEAVRRKVERTIEEKERAAAEANIAAITEWRESTSSVA